MSDEMTDDGGAGSAGPLTDRTGPLRLGSAALHPLVVTIPIGAFVCTLAFDVASRVVEGYAYARGALWLTVIGLVTAVVAGVVGGVDARRRVRGADDRRLAVRHAALNGGALLAFVISLVVRRADLDSLVDGTPTVALVLSVVGVALLVVSAVTGGTLAWRLDRPVVEHC